MERADYREGEVGPPAKKFLIPHAYESAIISLPNFILNTAWELDKVFWLLCRTIFTADKKDGGAKLEISSSDWNSLKCDENTLKIYDVHHTFRGT